MDTGATCLCGGIKSMGHDIMCVLTLSSLLSNLPLQMSFVS